MHLNLFRSRTVLNVWHTSPQVAEDTPVTIRQWRPLQKSTDIQREPSPLYRTFIIDTETRAHHSQRVRPQLGVTPTSQLRCPSIARQYSARRRNYEFNIAKPKVFRPKGFQRDSSVALVTRCCHTTTHNVSSHNWVSVTRTPDLR